MKIAYSGSFLLEGLQELGHCVYDMSVEGGADWLEKIPPDADLLLLELYGNRQIPKGMARAQLPVVTYCIDSPINEFWLGDCAAQSDYIFVDQAESVERLGRQGLKASFLPLAARRDWFLQKERKKFDISFVGTVDNERLKRRNLLKHIGRYFDVNIASNISFLECQRLFAQSRIVLNENFFNGLTLRVFQAMASGSLLCTESGRGGIYECLDAEGTFATYGPDNLVPMLHNFLQKPRLCELMGESAQKNCLAGHTVTHRAGELLQMIGSTESLNFHKSDEERLFRESAGMVNFILRFGGNLGAEIKNLKRAAASDRKFSGQAKLILGRTYALLGRMQDAQRYIREAAMESPSCDSLLNVALLELAAKNQGEAEKAYALALRAAHEEGLGEAMRIFNFRDRRHRLYGAIASLQLARGRDLDFGFKKAMSDPLPDTACEIGQLLWNEKGGADSLEIMCQSVSAYGIEGSLLPMLVQAFNAGILGRERILKSAAIAKNYYDFDLEQLLLKAADTTD